MQWETLPHRDGSGRGSLRPRYDAGQAGSGAKVSKSGLAIQPNHDGQDTLFGMIVAVFLEGRADRSKLNAKGSHLLHELRGGPGYARCAGECHAFEASHFPEALIRKVR